MANGTEKPAPLTWFVELRPLLTIVLTAATGGITTYCSVDKHGQRVQDQELQLKKQQFDADELGKYLALPEKDVVTKRAMATYLQAVYFSRGESALHDWATKEIDEIRLQTETRRAILANKRAELGTLKTQRDVSFRAQSELAAKLAGGTLSDGERAKVEAELKERTSITAALTADVNRARQEFEEETVATLDLNGLVNTAATGVGYCQITDLSAKSPLPQKVVPMTAADCAAACLGVTCSASFSAMPPAAAPAGAVPTKGDPGRR